MNTNKVDSEAVTVWMYHKHYTAMIKLGKHAFTCCQQSSCVMTSSAKEDLPKLSHASSHSHSGTLLVLYWYRENWVQQHPSKCLDTTSDYQGSGLERFYRSFTRIKWQLVGSWLTSTVIGMLSMRACFAASQFSGRPVMRMISQALGWASPFVKLLSPSSPVVSCGCSPS